VDADDLIDDMFTLAKKEINKRHKNLSEKEINLRAKAISLSAIKFHMLRTDPVKDMVFDPKESISFEGETGPYVQYAYARIASILRKYGKKLKQADFSVFGDDEACLVKQLAKFPDIVGEAGRHYKPSLICRYLLDLAQMLGEYYHRVPVLKAPENEKLARLALIDAVARVIKSGLLLLDIDVLEEM